MMNRPAWMCLVDRLLDFLYYLVKGAMIIAFVSALFIAILWGGLYLLIEVPHGWLSAAIPLAIWACYSVGSKWDEV